MSKNTLRAFGCLALLLLVNLVVPSGARAQGTGTVGHPPYELHRFHMGSTNGYLYTPWYSIASNAGYTYAGSIHGVGGTAGIYPNPGDGSVPEPSTGLTPLYQWTVFEGIRSYIYLSPYLGSHGRNYHFNGVVGYVYPYNVEVDPFGFSTHKLSAWYSQTRGYWYGHNQPGDSAGFQSPPNSSYAFHGLVARLPTAEVATGPNRRDCFPCQRVALYTPPPPPPPPSCDSYDEQFCWNSGGWWDSNTCSCNNYNN